MAKRNNISMSVIRRLPRYYRYLTELMENNITRISSKELSVRMKLTASQIRQDLNCFGGFGQQGYGYIVEQLRDEIAQILGITENKSVIVLGAGNLGLAVGAYLQYETRGFELVGIFDNNQKLIGKNVFGETVISDVSTLEDFLKNNHVDIVALCLPKAAADSLVELVYNCGMRYFWNFSHFNVSRKYRDVIVEAVHLNDSLMTLGYLITKAEESSNSDKGSRQ